MRRIVTGRSSDGQSVVVDDHPPAERIYKSVPGLSISLVWATEPGTPATSSTDSTTDLTSLVPPVGGTRLMRLVLPPDSVMMSPDFDGMAFATEHQRNAPGLAELFEPDGMHATPTVDYSIVLEGEVWLETGGGELTELGPGDVVVQNGTHHAWRNRSDKPAVLLSALIGAPSA